MHEDTAQHTPIDVDLQRIDELLNRSRMATAIGAILFVAAVIVGAIAIARAWPPPALQQREASVHS